MAFEIKWDLSEEEEMDVDEIMDTVDTEECLKDFIDSWDLSTVEEICKDEDENVKTTRPRRRPYACSKPERDPIPTRSKRGNVLGGEPMPDDVGVVEDLPHDFLETIREQGADMMNELDRVSERTRSKRKLVTAQGPVA